ncbi:hypothetical protein M422DRAFT_275849 [Sphaerobolus stellatus SS14]|uniref:Uncharacterized protein n=1 Tax=Sphaerobolus stellatus (strain SS14) TaxID=990650 RepID=A0A0C9UDN1_SPHS4|nr:hypothetical protein M422DRAFT_275849 [Sphaerobolus stellatus SS14]
MYVTRDKTQDGGGASQEVEGLTLVFILLGGLAGVALLIWWTKVAWTWFKTALERKAKKITEIERKKSFKGKGKEVVDEDELEDIKREEMMTQMKKVLPPLPMKTIAMAPKTPPRIPRQYPNSPYNYLPKPILSPSGRTRLKSPSSPTKSVRFGSIINFEELKEDSDSAENSIAEADRTIQQLQPFGVLPLSQHSIMSFSSYREGWNKQDEPRDVFAASRSGSATRPPTPPPKSKPTAKFIPSPPKSRSIPLVKTPVMTREPAPETTLQVPLFDMPNLYGNESFEDWLHIGK